MGPHGLPPGYLKHATPSAPPFHTEHLACKQGRSTTPGARPSAPVSLAMVRMPFETRCETTSDNYRDNAIHATRPGRDRLFYVHFQCRANRRL